MEVETGRGRVGADWVRRNGVGVEEVRKSKAEDVRRNAVGAVHGNRAEEVHGNEREGES